MGIFLFLSHWIFVGFLSISRRIGSWISKGEWLGLSVMGILVGSIFLRPGIENLHLDDETGFLIWRSFSNYLFVLIVYICGLHLYHTFLSLDFKNPILKQRLLWHSLIIMAGLSIYSAFFFTLFHHSLIASFFLLHIFHCRNDKPLSASALVAYPLLNWAVILCVGVFNNIQEQCFWSNHLPLWFGVFCVISFYLTLTTFLFTPVKVSNKLRVKRVSILFPLFASLVIGGNIILRIGIIFMNGDLPFDTELHEAVRENDVDRVTEMLEDGWNVNTLDRCLSTPLHSAAALGYMEAAKVLIEHGAKIDPRRRLFWDEYHDPESTPLLMAVREHPDMVRLLLEHGADPNITMRGDIGGGLNALGATLQFERDYDVYPVVKMLLKYGADVNVGERTTPLHSAMQQDDIRVIELLLKNGADVNKFDRNLSKPLDYADTIEKAELLLKYGAKISHLKGEAISSFYVNDKKPNQLEKFYINKHADYSIYTACMIGDVTRVSIFLSIYPSVLNRQNAIGSAPIHIAVAYNHIEVVKLLLSEGADRNIKNSFEDTPLHIAAQKGYLDIAALLLDHGANIEARNRINNTPLHRAAGGRDLAMVKFLIARGADVLAPGQDGHTPFQESEIFKSQEVIDFLTEQEKIIDSTRLKSSKTIEEASEEYME